jgi:hypothetical protein
MAYYSRGAYLDCVEIFSQSITLIGQRPTRWLMVFGCWSGEQRRRQLAFLGRGGDTAYWRFDELVRVSANKTSNSKPVSSKKQLLVRHLI